MFVFPSDILWVVANSSLQICFWKTIEILIGWSIYGMTTNFAEAILLNHLASKKSSSVTGVDYLVIDYTETLLVIT